METKSVEKRCGGYALIDLKQYVFRYFLKEGSFQQRSRMICKRSFGFTPLLTEGRMLRNIFAVFYHVSAKTQCV